MRTTISIDDAVAVTAEGMAKREKRNFSNLCEVALDEYCAARGQVQDAPLLMAAAEQVGVPEAIALLTKAARAKHKEKARK